MGGQTLYDKLWQNHLTEMDELRQSVGLRGYGQKNPLQEYQSDAYHYVDQLMEHFRNQLCMNFFRSSTSAQAYEKIRTQFAHGLHTQGPSEETISQLETAAGPGQPISTLIPQAQKRPRIVKKIVARVGRNDPCPCESGKKYKQCCGR